MHRNGFLLALVTGFLLAGGRPVHAGPAARPEPDPIARLVIQLGSKHFKDREAATQALDAIGLPALEPLRRAARGTEPEVRRRAAYLVQKIEKRLESERLLAPRHLHLVWKDTPVPEAVNELSRQAGVPIVLSNADRARLADRKITLDTGETTFWDALDQLCRKATLVERRQEPTKAHADRVLTDGRGGQIIIMDGNLTTGSPPQSRLTLADGKPEPLPTCQAGGVRVRALAPSTPHPGLRKTHGETFVLLEILPEAAIKWRGVVDVQVERAVDDRGQSLAQVLGSSGFAGLDLDLGGNLLPFIEADGEMLGADPHQVPIRLRRGEGASRVLKELRGRVGARVETIETLVTVEDLLKASGRTYHGTDGSTLRVVDVRPQDDGRVRLDVSIEAPGPGMAGAGQMIRGNRRIIFVNRNVEMGMADNNWSLVDASGQKLTLLQTSARLRRGFNGFSQEASFVFPGKNAKGPLTLRYTGQRTATVEVPFTLKDVPLP
jgi:hypothetical protein